MTLLSLLALLQFFTASAEGFLKNSEEQASYYISQINRGRDIEENLWALSVLSSAHPELKTFVEKKVRQNPNRHPSLSLFKDIEENFYGQLKKIVFNTGSDDLLIALLLETASAEDRRTLYRRYLSRYELTAEEADYAAVCQAIIKGRPLTPAILPNDNFLLPHFFILFKTDYSDYLSRHYLENIVDEWYMASRDFNSSLRATLSKITYFRILYLLDSYSKINELYHFLINNRLFPNSSLKLKIYRYLDYSMFRLGYFNRNLEIARDFTLPLAGYLGLESLRTRIKFTTGINLYYIGKLEQAEKLYLEIMQEKDKNYFPLRLSSLYNNLAITYYKLGKYDKYLELQFQAFETAKEKNNYSHQLEILNNLFIYYRRNNDQKNALFYLEEARKLAQKRNLQEIGNIYTSIGSVYRQFDSNYEKAHAYFKKAEKALDPQNNSEFYIYLLIEQAKTFEKQQKFAKAIKKYNEIIALTSKQKNPDYLDALVNKALVYLKAGNKFQAKRYIQKYKKYDLSKLDFVQVVKAKTVEANYLYQTGHIQKALTMLKPVLEQSIKRAQNSADMQTGFWYISDEYLNAFELATSIYIEQEQPRKVIELLDRLKTINDASLYQNPLVKASVLNEAELTRYKRLVERLDNARKNLLAAPEGERFEIQQTINRLRLEKDALDQKLTDKADLPPVSVREIQNQLSAYELVLHITELKDKYYVGRIFRNKVTLEVIPLDSGLRKLLETTSRQVADHETDLHLLYSVSKILGLKKIPDRIEKVTVIPDSYLYRLPLEILPVEKPVHSYSYGETTYFIEKYKTNYLTSLNDFRREEDRSGKDYKLNLAAYGISKFGKYTQKSLVPLPFAEQEVHAIRDKMTNFSDMRIFLNDSSTKSAFLNSAPDARILHLATHSEVSLRDPLFSTFYMRKTTTDPDSIFKDRIFAYELFELDLNNEMIMLNSCESGSGSYLQGSGIRGISRALHYAGAQSLILNLWPVNDMLAAEFAVYFYGQLNQGKSKAEAIRATKLHFLETKNASPHFWGPYMLLGDPGPVIRPYKEVNLIVAGTFSLYFLLMAALSLLRKHRNRKPEFSDQCQ